jgi:hypothetical protein
MKFRHCLSDSLRYGWFRVKGSCLSMSETSLLVSHILQRVRLDLQQDLSMDWFRAMLLDDRLVHPRFAHCSQYHNSQIYKIILNEQFVALIVPSNQRSWYASSSHRIAAPTTQEVSAMQASVTWEQIRNRKTDPTDHDLLTAPRALVLTWPSQYPQPGSNAGMRCLVPWNRKLSTYMTGTDERSIMYGWNPEAFREGTGKYLPKVGKALCNDIVLVILRVLTPQYPVHCSPICVDCNICNLPQDIPLEACLVWSISVRTETAAFWFPAYWAQVVFSWNLVMSTILEAKQVT